MSEVSIISVYKYREKSLAYLSLFLSSLLTIINGINVPISATDDLNTISLINNYKDILSMDNSPLKVIILTNLALKYARQNNQKKSLKNISKSTTNISTTNR